MDCEVSRAFAICWRACGLIRERPRKRFALAGRSWVEKSASRDLFARCRLNYFRIADKLSSGTMTMGWSVRVIDLRTHVIRRIGHK